MDEIEKIKERLQKLAKAAGNNPGSGQTHEGYEAVSAALLASLEGHELFRHGFDDEVEYSDCGRCGEQWPCQVVDDVMTALGMTRPVVRTTIPDESKRLINRSLDSFRDALHNLRRAGAVLSAMTEDHQLVLIEVIWPSLGVIGAVEWDGEVEKWTVSDRPV